MLCVCRVVVDIFSVSFLSFFIFGWKRKRRRRRWCCGATKKSNQAAKKCRRVYWERNKIIAWIMFYKYFVGTQHTTVLCREISNSKILIYIYFHFRSRCRTNNPRSRDTASEWLRSTTVSSVSAQSDEGGISETMANCWFDGQLCCPSNLSLDVVLSWV